MKNEYLFNRELSWLSFNERVLQEAMDKNNPLLERVRFLGIYSNNLDEFFRVRVANLNRMISAGIKKVEGFEGHTKDLLEKVHIEIKKQRKVYEATYQRIINDLEEQNVYQVNEENISQAFKDYLMDYFYESLKQDIVPLILDKKLKFPRLQDKEIYLAVKMFNESNGKSKYALIQIPSQHNRFITFKENDKTRVILLDDVIRLFLPDIFQIFDFTECHAYTFKFTRDAELDLDDDYSVSMYDKIEESIEQRKRGEPLRLVYDENIDKDLLKYLKNALSISKTDHIAPGGRYHNSKDLMDFPQLLGKEFNFKKQKALRHPNFQRSSQLLEEVLKNDILLHYPYQDFDNLIDFLREAAIDPKVKTIKITIYRLAKKSQIINALVNALRNGKEVVAVFELQARFDEENNMYWSNILRDHGAKIIFGVPGFKVHAKLILIHRKSGKKLVKIAHIGTGNFHGVNAKIYTDFSLLTPNKIISKEVSKVFNLLENNIERAAYRNLLVSPFNTRRKFLMLINREIRNVKKGKKGEVLLKLNNLVDTRLINKLVEAAKEGVEIKCIIRGICCLKTSEDIPNLTVKSIVGRYLEHSRLIIFHNDGDLETYISSADWMNRNLDKRIEVTTPILDKNIKNQLLDLFNIEWSDNSKSRIIDERQINRYFKDDKEPLNAHEEIYEYYRNL